MALFAVAALALLASSAPDEGSKGGSSALAASRARRSMFWSWDNGREDARVRLDTDDVKFPPGFLWGTASAAHQVEGGCTNNNWARWEEGTDASTGLPRPRAGAACDHWHRFREDIALMKSLGLTSHRFSIEWSKIEPSPGVIDAAALAHYHEVIDALLAAGIEPMITLFHFTIPKWFEDLGGFEVESNSGFFVAFAQRAFAEFGAKCRLWCTVNEPEVYVEGGYSSGKFPPCQRDVHKAALVLRNLLEAHVLVYAALKAMPGGTDAQVGIVKDVFQFEPYNRFSPLDNAAAAIVDGVMNESILRFLRTGAFRFWMPGQVRLSRTNTRAPQSYDFIGLNYYSHYHVRVCAPGGKNPHPFELVHLPREEALMSELPYPLYPEGLYYALKRVGQLGRPVYVTESGIADGRDELRPLHLRRYLYAMSCALADGVDVRGYYHWTLTDNFEWAEGYAARFGLFACDPQTQVRTLRPSAHVLRSVVARHASGEAVLHPPAPPSGGAETLPILPAGAAAGAPAAEVQEVVQPEAPPAAAEPPAAPLPAGGAAEGAAPPVEVAPSVEVAAPVLGREVVAAPVVEGAAPTADELARAEDYAQGVEELAQAAEERGEREASEAAPGPDDADSDTL